MSGINFCSTKFPSLLREANLLKSLGNRCAHIGRQQWIEFNFWEKSKTNAFKLKAPPDKTRLDGSFTSILWSKVTPPAGPSTSFFPFHSVSHCHLKPIDMWHCASTLHLTWLNFTFHILRSLSLSCLFVGFELELLDRNVYSLTTKLSTHLDIYQ